MPDLGDNCSALSSRKRAAARNSSVTKPDVAREGKKLREGAKKFCERETQNFTFGNTVVPPVLQFCRFQNNAKARRGKPAKSRPQTGKAGAATISNSVRSKKKVSQKHAWNFHVISSCSRAWFHVCACLSRSFRSLTFEFSKLSYVRGLARVSGRNLEDGEFRH